jgi:adenosylcobinamide-phosphate synthase
MWYGRGGKLCLAFAIDLALGEPPERWHPVCWMGKAVSVAQRPFIGDGAAAGRKRSAGVVTAIALPAGSFLAAYGLLKVLPRPLRYAVEVLMLWTTLATRELYASAARVERDLGEGLDQGRARVARMVGRDTERLDESGVARSAIESVAENANDGVVAPLFYAFTGGAPLAMAYKMVNTLDSMVGYRNERYRDFGWAAARIDDAAGYIPARLTAGAVVASGAFAGADPAGAARVWRRDAAGPDSPNAGVCESAFAGALGVRLGGTDYYAGEAQRKAVLGEGLRSPEPRDILRAARLMCTVAVTVLAAAAVVLGCVSKQGKEHHGREA